MAGLFVGGGGGRRVTAAERDRAIAPGAGSSPWLASHPPAATLFIAATATTFALGSTIIRFAYDAGAGTLTIVMTRTTIAAVALAFLLAVLRVKVRLDRRERWAVPLIGLVMAGYSGAFYMGLEYMPVALTVVTFYTYPIITGLFSWLTGQERFGVAGMIALPLAFLGLVLALDVSGSSFSIAGAAWAMLGSFGFSAVLILSALLLPKRADTRPRTLVMLATASGACIAVTLATGEIWFPDERGGMGRARRLGVLLRARHDLDPVRRGGARRDAGRRGDERRAAREHRPHLPHPRRAAAAHSTRGRAPRRRSHLSVPAAPRRAAGFGLSRDQGCGFSP